MCLVCLLFFFINITISLYNNINILNRCILYDFSKNKKNSCTSEYPYNFNNKWFYIYEEEGGTGYNVNRKGSSKECIGDNLWRKNHNVECLSESVCNYYGFGYWEIFDNKEYLNDTNCLNDSPLIFYKINGYPTNSHINPNIQGKSICINDKIFYLPKSTTIWYNDYPYQIFKTKEYIIA